MKYNIIFPCVTLILEVFPLYTNITKTPFRSNFTSVTVRERVLIYQISTAAGYHLKKNISSNHRLLNWKGQ